MAVRVLISRDRIAARIEEMGRQITSDLRRSMGDASAAEPHVVLVPILTGSMVFTADLIRHIPLKMSIRPVTIKSYHGSATTSQGATIAGDMPTDLAGAHVLIVDDILDSGRTLGLIRRLFDAQRPASLRIAVLLRKDETTGRREEHVEVEYVGFDIGDEFVIGYGLDFDGYHRNLPDIGVLTPASG
ncbi:MAG TPA: hypoxanthine phosphoribosyltransferase [Phycisphaerales bacterium]|nr:hypoxanthine phosphoribosyltransferase [Phycisphaerales bacterium]